MGSEVGVGVCQVADRGYNLSWLWLWKVGSALSLRPPPYPTPNPHLAVLG